MIDLVLISGPNGSGKTTLALRLAEEARARGLTAAAVDMDELVEMVAGSDWSKVRLEQRELSSRLAGSICDELMELGTQLLVVAGSTVSPYEWDLLLRNARGPKQPFSILLRVSFEEAKRRAAHDTTRASTWDAATAARLFDAIDWSTVCAPHLELDTDGLDSDAVLDAVAAVVFPAS